MKYSKVFLSAIVLLLFAGLTSASSQIFKQGAINNLQFTCTINYQVPSNSATFNLSIYNQEGQVIIDNQEATQQGQGSFNYTLIPQTLGSYTIKEFCYDTTGNYSNIEFFQVTADGKQTQFPMVYVLIIIAFLFLIFSKYLNKLFETNLFNIFAAILLMISGILTIYPGFNYTNYSTIEGMALGFIFIGLGATLILKETEELE